MALKTGQLAITGAAQQLTATDSKPTSRDPCAGPGGFRTRATEVELGDGIATVSLDEPGDPDPDAGGSAELVRGRNGK